MLSTAYMSNVSIHKLLEMSFTQSKWISEFAVLSTEVSADDNETVSSTKWAKELVSRFKTRKKASSLENDSEDELDDNKTTAGDLKAIQVQLEKRVKFHPSLAPDETNTSPTYQAIVMANLVSTV
mmetsp:Transcript_785/g.1184  ORF Transcript_785/g.1184 Transcript_785/m.1184 type:complete len:125 (+) Transcript_785:725-1099(+)